MSLIHQYSLIISDKSMLNTPSMNHRTTQHHATQHSATKHQAGFTLIEMLVSLGIGLFLIAGVFTVYINSNKSQKTVESEVRLVDDARFALENITYDFKHAGIYGLLNHEDADKLVDDPESKLGDFNNIPGQCGGPGVGTDPGWVTNVRMSVLSSNDTNPYSGSCILPVNYAGGDVLEMRYVSRIDNALALDANVLYMRGDSNRGRVFVGSAPPAAGDFNALAENFKMVAKAYYVANYTNTPGDGLSSLRMVSLQSGPEVKDDLFLEGVIDMQLQFGMVADNTTTSRSVVTWVHPAVDGDANAADGTVDWDRVIAARIWLVLKSKERFSDVDTSTKLNVAGVDVSYPNDGFRRIVVSTAMRLRNMNTGF